MVDLNLQKCRLIWVFTVCWMGKYAVKTRVGPGIISFIVEPACGERDTVVTISVRCICVRACMHVLSSRIVRDITCTFVHGFQNNLAQLLSCHLEHLFR